VKRNTMARGLFIHRREPAVPDIGVFPARTADDKFIRNLTILTSAGWRRIAITTVHLPDNFRDLLKVKTRWTFGNLGLPSGRPELNVNDQEARWRDWGSAGRPWLWVNVPTFLLVWWYAKRAARGNWREKSGWSAMKARGHATGDAAV